MGYYNMNHTTLTLGELLTHSNETIKRNAMSILKTLQKLEDIKWYKDNTGKSPDCPHYINSDPYNPDGWKYCTQCKK
jgi:hypothetical protein